MRPKKYIVMLGKLMVAVNNFSIFIKNNLLSFFGHCSYTHFLLIYMKIFSIRINSLYQDVSHMTSQKGSKNFHRYQICPKQDLEIRINTPLKMFKCGFEDCIHRFRYSSLSKNLVNFILKRKSNPFI